jgi:hypothetical protein
MAAEELFLTSEAAHEDVEDQEGHADDDEGETFGEK